MQIFCDMGKSNNAAQLQPKIPQTKRAIEKFVWQAQALYEDEHVEVGNLKAKDLEDVFQAFGSYTVMLLTENNCDFSTWCFMFL